MLQGVLWSRVTIDYVINERPLSALTHELLVVGGNVSIVRQTQHVRG